MHSKFSGLLFLFITMTLQLYTQTNSTVTYLANEGFLIESQGKKILIDGIFDDKTINYADVPSDELLSSITSSNSPFNDVDVLLVTHMHRDHFSSIPVGKHLLNNSQAILICNSQTAEKFESEFPDYDKISSQVIISSPELEKTTNLNVNGISITTFGLLHSTYFVKDDKGNEKDLHAKIKVNGYLVEIGDFSFMHTGDTLFPQHTSFFENFELDKKDLDVLFLFGPDDESRRIVNEHMKPNEIILMHLPAEKSVVNEYYSPLKQIWDNVQFLTEPMEMTKIKAN